MADRNINILRNYFVRGEGIDRQVISSDIQRYLGSDATVRPGIGSGEDEGVPGYWVKAYRNLTSAMIADIKKDSAQWILEQGHRNSRVSSYENSDTRVNSNIAARERAETSSPSFGGANPYGPPPSSVIPGQYGPGPGSYSQAPRPPHYEQPTVRAPPPNQYDNRYAPHHAPADPPMPPHYPPNNSGGYRADPGPFYGGSEGMPPGQRGPGNYAGGQYIDNPAIGNGQYARGPPANMPGYPPPGRGDSNVYRQPAQDYNSQNQQFYPSPAPTVSAPSRDHIASPSAYQNGPPQYQDQYNDRQGFPRPAPRR